MNIPKPQIEQVGESDVCVRAMTFKQFAEYQDQIDENDPNAATVTLIRHTVCNADGTLVYVNGSDPPIGDWPAKFVLEVCEVAMRLNLPEGDVLGNFAAAAAAASRSG